MIRRFGTTSNGDSIQQITLSNDQLTIKLLTFGAALQDVRLTNIPHSLTVGTPDLTAYENGMQYSGTIMGPVGNRIGGASARINGKTHSFDQNLLNQHTLHGGSAAFHNKLWTLQNSGPDHATMTLSAPNNLGGFPGNRQITARYDLNNADLTLTLTATTDAPTLMNPCNHSYWNLGPDPTTKGHHLTVYADKFLPTHQPSALPTGEIADVTGTRFDYRQPREIEAGVEGLIDNNFCLSQTRQPLREIATLTGPTGITLCMSSTEPGLQVFDGHGLDLPGVTDMDGTEIQPYAGLALEAQFWPNATNNPDFPSIILQPNDPWQQITAWTFQTTSPDFQTFL